jgi:hypothetical protein
MLPDTILPGGAHLDQACTSVLQYSLIKLHKGKIQNKGNLKWAARRCNIANPLGLSMGDILLQVDECKCECYIYMEHGKRFQTKHLNERLCLAQEREDEEAMEKIAAIIQQEKQHSFWRWLNYVTGKKHTRSATSIQVPAPSGLVTELSMQEPVEDAIFSEVHETGYTLAKEAHICSGKLFNDFGYVANTPASKAVLDGRNLPPSDSDTATKELFNKIAAIRKIIPKDSVNPVITPVQWKWYWAIVNKETSSSESGLHFSHYIIGSKSDIIAHYHAARVMVVLAHAIQLKHWSRGLSVMLKKTLGVTLVTKLRAILLMEADFNSSNKIIYGFRIMGQARDHNLMSDEIYSEKIWMVDNETLTKTLYFDIAHQARTPAAIASVDASNCFNKIMHTIASLVFQAFGVPELAIEFMLGAIENMKFLFLRTSFGDSKRFAGGGVSVKVQGLTQGNRSPPSGWAVISIMILRAHVKKGHSIKFRCPITNLSAHILAILYVDNTDLLHINFDHDESVDDAHAAMNS